MDTIFKLFIVTRRYSEKNNNQKVMTVMMKMITVTLNLITRINIRKSNLL